MNGVCDSSDLRLQILNGDRLVESLREESVDEENDYVEIVVDMGLSAGKAFASL